jgi:SPP1 gp7 family putative phage head morphogenesis protein
VLSLLAVLLAQVEQEVGKYAEYADASIRRQQSAAIEAAGQHAEALTRAAMGDAPTDEARLALRWNRLPREAMVEMMGSLSDGAPLEALLGELGPDAAQRVKDALLEGLAMGRNPRVIARDVRRNMGMPLTRSLRIARTETLRAHRLATLANFQANSDVVKGWRWSASHSSRTCLACLAMDGKVFPLDKPPPMHVNCRCSCIPVTVSWQDLGVDAPEPDLGETGAEWFKAQPASVQREMMGDEAYKAWKSGRVTLDDFVGVRKSRRWGDQVEVVRPR